MSERPTPGTVEVRSAPEAPLSVEGNRLCGLIPYAVESRDLGGWSEVMEPGSLSAAARGDLVCTLNHDVSKLLGRHPSTLEVEERDDGLAWSCELPGGPTGQDVREAVKRGDLNATSWRMVVGRDRWDGTCRHVEEVRELRDVAVVTTGAYPAEAARAELRAHPDEENPPAEQRNEIKPAEARAEEEQMENEQTREGGGGLTVEDRAGESEAATVEERVLEAIRSVSKGESRDLTNADNSGGPISPTELSNFLFDRLRPASIALASGLVVIPTSRQKVTWPQLVSDVDPTWVEELEAIPADEPGFDSLEAEPKKLAHLVSPISNEVIDDSEPSAVDVLNGHLVTMLGLKLDRSIFEGPSSNPKSITGLKFQSGTQSISMGTNGAALEDYDPIIEAVGKLRDANVPGPYAVAGHGSVLTALELLKEADGSRVQLAAPANLPPFYTTSQLSINETKGTATNARSIYVYAPGQVVLVRRKEAQIELDRSRLFNDDASEMRGILRADLLLPNPQAVVRIDGVIPAA